jgi:hypothetical protein
MELNDFRPAIGRVKAPAAGNKAAPELGDLVNRLRQAEERELENLRKGRLLYGIAVVLSAAISIVVLLAWIRSPGSDGGWQRPIYHAGLLGAFLVAALGATAKLRRLALVDYSQPVSAFLAQAETRFAFMSPADYLLSLAGLVALALATGPYVVDLVTERYLSSLSRSTGALIYTGFYLSVAVFGYWATWANWRRDRAPFLEEIRQTRRSLAGTDANPVDPS